MSRWHALRGAIIVAVVVFGFVAILVDAALPAAGAYRSTPGPLTAGDVVGLISGAAAGTIAFRRSRQGPKNAVSSEPPGSLAAVGGHDRSRANLLTSAIVAVVSVSVLCYLALNPPAVGDRKPILGVHSPRTIVLTYLSVAFVLVCSVMDLYGFFVAVRQRKAGAIHDVGGDG